MKDKFKKTPFTLNYLNLHLKKIIRFCIFCVILYPCSSCNSFQNSVSMEEKNQDWKIVKVDKKKKPSWTISTRKIGNTNLIEYKIEGEIQAASKACLASFKQDMHDLAGGEKNKKYPTYEIIDETEDSLLTYVIHKEPFIFKNTEMSVKYLFSSDASGNTKVMWCEDWVSCSIPPSKKLKRIETFRGAWNFLTISNNRTKAENSVQFNPKKMPRWLFEPMVSKFLIEGLEGIRRKTSK